MYIVILYTCIILLYNTSVYDDVLDNTGPCAEIILEGFG